MSFPQSRFWRRNWALFVVPVAVPLAIVAAFWIKGGPLEHLLGVPVLEADLSGPPIPYDHLANEDTDPHYYSDGRRVHDDWLAAIARYPDVRDCLEPDERTAKQPDLRRFDWVGVRGHMNQGICLHRVFSSLGTPERAVLWMEAQGFEGDGPRLGKGRDGNEFFVDGGYSPSKDGVLLPGGSVLGRWITSKLVYGHTITARWSEDGRLLRVGISSNSL